MKLNVHYIDAFTDSLFKGNPAAVIISDTWLSDELMQSIAAENNLSETAFAVKTKAGYRIRWFSPLTEIEFCGHATLATAYVLFNQYSKLRSINFYAKAVGELEVHKARDGFIQMIFPNRMPEPVDDIPEALIDGLSIKPTEVYVNQQAYFAIYSDAEQVFAVEQDQDKIRQLKPYDVTVTAPAAGYDFVSRYFWPANGGDEDPVTGSIHTGLAPFWSERLGKQDLRAYQASRRGGELLCKVDRDRVFIQGKAVSYLSGIIEI
ncbi:PhzF family phenazine biosynthesis protein [Seongchinamella unica]|uniref:PhzF family phenazine biosynthesis protein n=1 Tax=Seongchinamella unica TaxID=2547392 RepID=A0A4V2ZXE1_9GAMM|nr:PhzF family phenazine biosynthesis protein [Seongchinamella unica]TDG14685.1 PhzF family phenazine biosynthesis protein [Seongchinamella unica]